MKGASRDLTTLFMEAKQRSRGGDVLNRFKPKTKLLQDKLSDSTNDSNQKFQYAPINHKALQQQSLPPEWIDI